MNSCSQREGEFVKQFITSLNSLAESCEYREIKAEVIRNHIILGTTLSEQLRTSDTKLILDKATIRIEHEQQVTPNGGGVKLLMTLLLAPEKAKKHIRSPHIH